METLKNVPSDYNVVCFLTKDGEFTPLSSLVVASFSKHCTLRAAIKEANLRTSPTIKALQMCHSVPWKCLFTIIYCGASVEFLHRCYFNNYEDELPF